MRTLSRSGDRSATAEPTATRLPAALSQGDGLPALGELLANRYELVREIGHGGSGVVFAARDLLVGRDVAIKLLRPEVLDPAGTERLRREVRGAGVGHPNLIGVYDLLEDPDRQLTFLVLELVQGTSLRERMREESTLPVDEVVGIGLDIANALNHLHAQGLVHRDVKPANILLASDGTAKLCDLGLVRPVDTGETVTETAMAIGTPAYMAPEQGVGRSIGPPTDVYALGLTLFSALSGEVPLREDSAVATMLRRRTERAPALRWVRSDAPRWLERLLGELLDREPKRRPSSCAVAQALRMRRWRPRVTLHAAAIIGIILAGAVIAFLGSSVATREVRATRVEVQGADVIGFSGEGTRLWTYHLPRPPREYRQVDLDADGAMEHIFVIRATSSSNSAIVILRDNGSILTHTEPEGFTDYWTTGFPRRFALDIWHSDVDGDGLLELLVGCRQLYFYPYTLLIYWPTTGIWQPLYHHEGYLYDIEIVTDSSTPRLYFLAVNNLLGMSPVVGVLKFSVNRRDRSSSWPVAANLVAYTLLTSNWSSNMVALPRQLELKPDGGSKGTTTFAEFELDEWGNPVASQNAGVDLRQERLDFADSLMRLLDNPRAALEPTTAFSQIKTLGAPLLSEPVYRSVFDTVHARVIAQDGRLTEARHILRTSCDRRPTPDGLYRLAHFQALSGELESAHATLLALRSRPITGRSRYDAPQLILRIGIEQRSAAKVDRAVKLLNNPSQPKFDGFTTAVWARAHLWWDECTRTDTMATSYPFAPAGEAMACLARWRLASSRPDDVRAMQDLIERQPDAEHEARVALAAAQLAAGDAADARVTLDQLILDLEPLSHDDFSYHQILDLSQAVRVLAMTNQGEIESARAEARRLLEHLTPGLLPAKLCEEVLAQSGSG